MNLEEFCTANGITMWIEARATRPDLLMDDMPRHFKFIVFGPHGSMEGYFSQGSAHKVPPTLPEVLDSLASDAYGVQEDFHAWASDLGFDLEGTEEERYARRVYAACERVAENLIRILGRELYDTLVYEVERL